MSRRPKKHKGPDDARIEEQAAAWVIRQARGLTSEEQDGLSDWLSADPRHGVQYARHHRQWARIDVLAEWQPEHSRTPNPDLLRKGKVESKRRLLRAATWAVAAVVAVAFIVFSVRPDRSQDRSRISTTAGDASLRVLEDGSVVKMNEGTDLSVRFSVGERRIQLERGEAHFLVKKDSSRPFIVTVNGLEVRATGTAFNVRRAASAVDVLVTEGRVQVDPVPDRREASSPTPVVTMLAAEQRALFQAAEKPEQATVATVTPEEIDRMLSWQHLLNFSAIPLSEIIAEFNRRNKTQLTLADEPLAALRITAKFRSDNIEGFVHLLEGAFGVKAERIGESQIVLRRAR